MQPHDRRPQAPSSPHSPATTPAPVDQPPVADPATEPLRQSPPPPSPAGPGLGEIVSSFFSNWFVSWFFIPLVIVLLLHFYVFSAYHVVGTSMTPTLQNGDYLIVSKVNRTGSLLGHNSYIPHRGEIVVFHYPKQPDLDFVKRVAALPGERIVVNNCTVTIYNHEHPSGFSPDATHQINGTCTDGVIDETIPQDNVFVLGDNRLPGGSSDSREWGLLPSYDIVGNAVLRLYPFDKVSVFGG